MRPADRQIEAGPDCRRPKHRAQPAAGPPGSQPEKAPLQPLYCTLVISYFSYTSSLHMSFVMSHVLPDTRPESPGLRARALIFDCCGCLVKAPLPDTQRLQFLTTLPALSDLLQARPREASAAAAAAWPGEVACRPCMHARSNLPSFPPLSVQFRSLTIDTHLPPQVLLHDLPAGGLARALGPQESLQSACSRAAARAGRAAHIASLGCVMIAVLQPFPPPVPSNALQFTPGMQP